MAAICVRTGFTNINYPAGSTIVLDFSESLVGGLQILSFAVGLSGYTLDYVTVDSPYLAEPLYQLGVSLVPQLLGSQIVVMASVMMSDNDGDAAGNPNEDGEPGSQVYVTAVALVGTADEALSTDVLGNVFGVQSGAALPTVASSNLLQAAGLAGFYMVDQNQSGHEISSFDVSVTTNTSGGQLSGSVSCVAGSTAPTATIDAFMISASPSLGLMSQTSITYLSFYEARGKAYSISATFSVPEGYELSNCGIVLQQSGLSYESGSHDFMIIDCFPYSQTIEQSGQQYTVTWIYNMNIYNPDFLVSDSYLGSATISAVAFAECAVPAYSVSN